MTQEHWSTRLAATLQANQQPTYELLEESLQGLLQDHNNLKAVAKDISKTLGEIVFARMQGDTEGALQRVDEVIAKNVVVRVAEPETKH
ncbi:hypothetical protein B0920_02190 [Massilia sp. KIM]|uniref:hypothetical protein n=1 Tax=Massilia sp. KIM TaxID=1955422 RepID=UPI00098EC30C|nr:hypothetical protein [Massilia sp. KIM]OON62308.1 hypothetical protein B0920_02190 [Massilia sp. KIM]